MGTSRLLVLALGGGIELPSVVPLVVSMAHGTQAQADRVSAFETYPKALQKRLALDDDAAPVPEKRDRAPSSVELRRDAPVRLALALAKAL